MANHKVDKYIERAIIWQKETQALRAILLDCGLSEAMKWGKPCYTIDNSNIAIIQGFKKFCALMFFKGVLLKDPSKILKEQGQNTQAARRIPFTSVEEITALRSVLKVYIREAIEVERKGLKVNFRAKSELTLAKELENALNNDHILMAAFRALTPGRQRAYNMYFSAAKQQKTRLSRIEKYIPKILDGKGLNDY